MLFSVKKASFKKDTQRSVANTKVLKLTHHSIYHTSDKNSIDLGK